MRWTRGRPKPISNRWWNEVSNALAQVNFGVICLTDVNRGNPWLNFEAGALAKSIEKGRVCPYLIGPFASRLEGPLAQFQGVRADRDGTLSLLQSMVDNNNVAFDRARLVASFDKWWPDLNDVLENLPEASQQTASDGSTWPLLKTEESLRAFLSELSPSQSRLFRELLKSDDRLDSKIFKEYFQCTNRIGGYRSDGLYPHMLTSLLGMERPEILYRCKDLERDQLIRIRDLSDKCFRVSDAIIRLVNKAPALILDCLYSKAERDKPAIEEHHGGVHYEDGKPSLYVDLDGIPLEGTFRIERDEALRSILFRSGKVVERR